MEDVMTLPLTTKETETALLRARLGTTINRSPSAKRHVKIAIAAMLLLVVYVIFAWWVMMTPPRRESLHLPAWTPPEKQYVAERMKFHGITSCVRDAEGYYFIRSGQRCRL